MSDKDEVRKIDINIPGDNNTFVANADTVNISSANNVILVGEELKNQEMISFGEIQISLEDSKLLEDFKKDYDRLIYECVKTDFTAPWVRIDLSDDIDFTYREKWELKSLKFKNKELRKMIFETISALSELSGYLTDQYMRAVDTPQGFVLIARHESWELGCQLREVLRPNTERLRYKLRDLYRELHPEEYEGMPPFEDHYEEE